MRPYGTANRRGQFLPIAAMVIFTIVVFILAVINVYRVAKVKLQLQNIADAVALNIAAREASSLNFVADRNKWLNKLYSNDQMNTDPDPDNPNCPSDLTKQSRMPGISCVEQDTANFSFPSTAGALGYARLVKSVNDSQRLAARAYDTFMGVGGGIGRRALQDILMNDIPDLRADPTIRLITWNSQIKKTEVDQEIKRAADSPDDYFAPGKPRVSPFMESLADTLQAHDITFQSDGKYLGVKQYGRFKNQHFKTILNSDENVGWMEIKSKVPALNVAATGSAPQSRIGAGAFVLKPVKILGVTFVVSAHSVAYVVPKSGSIPVQGMQTNRIPTFSPTYWVKLVNSK